MQMGDIPYVIGYREEWVVGKLAEGPRNQDHVVIRSLVHGLDRSLW